MPTRNQACSKRIHKAAGATRPAASDAKARSPGLAAGATRLTAAIGREATANFRAWFERNFADPRAGRVGDAPYSRAGVLDDRQGDWTWYLDAYGRAFYDHTEPLAPDEEDYLLSHPLVMFQLVLGITDLRGLSCLRRGLTLRTNELQRKAYRSRYYARDNARRRLLAAERRKVRRRTTSNPCPAPDEFRATFAKARESAEAKIRFGGMVHDLACYVDSCLRYDENGDIVGRNGGIRAWIAENAPELSPRYKTIMRYKALAMRVRQLTGLDDPQPTSVLLGTGDTGAGHGAAQDAATAARRGSDGSAAEGGGDGKLREADGRGEAGIKNYYASDSHHEGRGGGDADEKGRKRRRNGPCGEERERRDQEWKRERLRLILAGCRNTFKDVFERIDAELEQASPTL